MSHWEATGQSDEWYTPKYIFDAMDCRFDLDPANAAIGGANVPCAMSYGSGGLESVWQGFIWLNPPFGGRNGLVPWLNRFFQHGSGVCLVPDRTSAPWWQAAVRRADLVLFIDGKVKFERPDGSIGKSPSTGTCLMAKGGRRPDRAGQCRRGGSRMAGATVLKPIRAFVR